MDILKNKPYVLELLQTKPHLRDDDYKLISNVWHKALSLNKIEAKEITAFRFFELFSEGSLPHPESIRRIRAKLQEEFPELRGEKYKIRHKEEDKVKDQLYNTPELYQGGTP